MVKILILIFKIIIIKYSYSFLIKETKLANIIKKKREFKEPTLDSFTERSHRVISTRRSDRYSSSCVTRHHVQTSSDERNKIRRTHITHRRSSNRSLGHRHYAVGEKRRSHRRSSRDDPGRRHHLT